jgi:superfamily I DNA/RNA helicase
MKRHLVLGGPGAGKTERLMTLIEDALKSGVPPERIAFVSFTKSAVREAVDRFAKKFGFAQNRAPHFRTVHSMCYRELGLRRDQVLDARKLRDFGREIGVRITGGAPGEEAPTIEGDRMVFIMSVASAKRIRLKEAWEDLGEVDWTTLKWFADSLSKMKKHRGWMDFSDMLEEYVKSASRALDVDLAVVDEAQDLTLLQWEVAEKAFAQARRWIVAGDDDQALYEWSGADVEKFRSLSVDSSEVLPKSHRMPMEIFALAKEISSRIEDRYPKEWTSADHSGGVHYVGVPSHLDLSSGKWLLLARNNYLLKQFEDECRAQGAPYLTKRGSSVDPHDVQVILDHEKIRKGERLSSERTSDVLAMVADGDPAEIWHESFRGMPLEKRAYYLTMLKRGEKIREQPRVRIDTIHGAKGLEADNVALISDVSPKSSTEMAARPDSENRVLYVGVSRAKVHLYVLSPQTLNFFDV